MLCQFTFKNFKSYKNEAVLDMQAVSSQGFADSLLKSGDNQSFLPVSVIYGPNGGGKSNVIEAFSCMWNLVITPILIFKSRVIDRGEVNCIPFLFDKDSRTKPVEFEIYFKPNDEFEYRYTIKISQNGILEESLYRKKTVPRSRISLVFERFEDKITLGRSINRSSINKTINDRMPFLSFLYINYKLSPITDVIRWFEKGFVCNYANYYAEKSLFLKMDKDFKNNLIKFMNNLDINISNYVVSQKDKNSVEIFFEHNVNDEKYLLNIEQESSGTQKIFSVLPHIMNALSNGGLIVLDELDAKLHPKMLRYIILLFKNPDINKHNAQLIFTSHDVSVMKSSVFRTDEIWFACKLDDESSDLYSLYEMRDESGNHIQPSAAFDKQYLEGRYGADPYFRTMMDWK